MSFDEEKYKVRLSFDGYHLYPVLQDLLTGKGQKFFNYINKHYGEALFNYVKSVSKGGSSIEKSLPPVVCGSSENLQKFLAMFLIMLEDLQGRKFTPDNTKLIKDKNEIEEEYAQEYNFNNYTGIAIMYINKNFVDNVNMEVWRLNQVLEAVTSRQQDRLPVIVLSEKSLSSKFADKKLFTYISLFSKKDQQNNTTTNNNVTTVPVEIHPDNSHNALF